MCYIAAQQAILDITSLLWHIHASLSVLSLYNWQDYPSIGQISEKLDEFDIIPIFAVVETIQEIYNVIIIIIVISSSNVVHYMYVQCVHLPI